MWGGNLTLFAVFYGYLVRFLHQSGKWKGMLNSSIKAVEWGETLMQWLSLLVDFGQVTRSLGVKIDWLVTYACTITSLLGVGLCSKPRTPM